MRRTLSFLIAASLVALIPVTALAQEVEFEAELGELETAVGNLAGTSVEEWTAAAGEVDTALAALKAAAAELDYAEFDAAVAGLAAAIQAGDLAEIEAAAAELAPAVEALRAQAVAAAGDGTEQPTTVETGSGVDRGPNVALLGVAGLLALLASGAWALRATTMRR